MAGGSRLKLGVVALALGVVTAVACSGRSVRQGSQSAPAMGGSANISGDGGSTNNEGFCSADGERHTSGTRWLAPDGCNWCECTVGGDASCTLTACVAGRAGAAGETTARAGTEGVAASQAGIAGIAAGGVGAGGAAAGGLNDPGGTHGQAGESFGCVYDSVARIEGQMFLATDGCNSCQCQQGQVSCTESDCAPTCTPRAPGRLCVVGDSRGDMQEFSVGTLLEVQVEPLGCISAWCNDVLINTVSVSAAPSVTPNHFSAHASYCFEPNRNAEDPQFCADCGSYAKVVVSELPLAEGTNTVALEGTNVSVTFDVPSVVPAGSLCADVAH